MGEENKELNPPYGNKMVKNSSAEIELFQMAFDLLSDTRDVNAALDLLLEQIGRRYHLSFAAVFEYGKNGQELLLTNCYAGGARDFWKGTKYKVPQALEEAEFGCPVEVSNTRSTKEKTSVFGKRDKRLFLPEPIIAVKFVYSGGSAGMLGIGMAVEGEAPDAKETEALKSFGRVTAAFVSLRKKLRDDRQTIHQLKHRDKLTGLYDRDTFWDKFTKEMKNRQSGAIYALAFLDVNNFSYVNENFGTAVGDRILCEVADLISIRKKFALFSSRMYSDYFATLLKAASKEEITESIAFRNRLFEQELKEKYPAGGINLSTGICFLEQDDALDNVLESANLARKYAKEQKIGTGVVFAPHMRQKRDDFIYVSSRFHGALKNGEFEVFLQPKFLLKEREVYGAEALARWRLEDGAILPPDRFIPSLEDTGYIAELDFYIFEQLVRLMKKWRDAGRPAITVSTNFSRRHFENDGQCFLKRMKEIMDRYPVPAQYIEIEVTESAVVNDIETMKNCMFRLAEMGFRIAIDDFGTGYSSLNVLLEIPANVIKMDKTFTDKLEQEKQRHFVSKIGELIKAAKEEVIFEGIETEEQLGFLKNCGFNYGQGYLFDRPIPVAEFERKYL